MLNYCTPRRDLIVIKLVSLDQLRLKSQFDSYYGATILSALCHI